MAAASQIPERRGIDSQLLTHERRVVGVLLGRGCAATTRLVGDRATRARSHRPSGRPRGSLAPGGSCGRSRHRARVRLISALDRSRGRPRGGTLDSPTPSPRRQSPVRICRVYVSSESVDGVSVALADACEQDRQQRPTCRVDQLRVQADDVAVEQDVARAHALAIVRLEERGEGSRSPDGASCRLRLGSSSGHRASSASSRLDAIPGRDDRKHRSARTFLRSASRTTAPADADCQQPRGPSTQDGRAKRSAIRNACGRMRLLRGGQRPEGRCASSTEPISARIAAATGADRASASMASRSADRHRSGRSAASAWTRRSARRATRRRGSAAISSAIRDQTKVSAGRVWTTGHRSSRSSAIASRSSASIDAWRGVLSRRNP